MGNKISVNKVEIILRIVAFLTLLIAGLVIVKDSQSKIIFYKQTANYKLAPIGKMYVYVHFIGAAYSLLQFLRCLVFSSHQKDQLTSSTHFQKWTYFTLDQVTVYVIFATNCAITEIGFLVLTGAEALQWIQLCNKFPRFCIQAGVGAIFGYISFLLLALISAISTFHLFRWYSPNFLCLKPKKIGVVAPAS